MDIQQDIIFGLIFICGVVLSARVVNAVKMHQTLKEEFIKERARLLRVEELYGRKHSSHDKQDNY